MSSKNIIFNTEVIARLAEMDKAFAKWSDSDEEADIGDFARKITTKYADVFSNTPFHEWSSVMFGCYIVVKYGASMDTVLPFMASKSTIGLLSVARAAGSHDMVRLGKNDYAQICAFYDLVAKEMAGPLFMPSAPTSASVKQKGKRAHESDSEEVVKKATADSDAEEKPKKSKKNKKSSPKKAAADEDEDDVKKKEKERKEEEKRAKRRARDQAYRERKKARELEAKKAADAAITDALDAEIASAESKNGEEEEEEAAAEEKKSEEEEAAAVEETAAEAAAAEEEEVGAETAAAAAAEEEEEKKAEPEEKQQEEEEEVAGPPSVPAPAPKKPAGKKPAAKPKENGKTAHEEEKKEDEEEPEPMDVIAKPATPAAPSTPSKPAAKPAAGLTISAGISAVFKIFRKSPNGPLIVKAARSNAPDTKIDVEVGQVPERLVQQFIEDFKNELVVVQINSMPGADLPMIYGIGYDASSGRDPVITIDEAHKVRNVMQISRDVAVQLFPTNSRDAIEKFCEDVLRAARH